ncbi:MAG: 1-deoxy-D-xylulose-5-phosphate synthase N-terminal domain-containing protein [Candidatus Goldiibacteriota bacterium]
MTTDEIKEAKRVAAGIRKRVLTHTLKHNGGYLSQACSSADALAALYTKIMKLGPVETPFVPKPFPGVPGPDNHDYFTGGYYNGAHMPEYDRFILSPAHYALALYACLIETGRMDETGLDYFNKDGSSVEMIGSEHSPGMEVTNGSLGQAISQAAGIALARRLKKEAGRVFVFLSDGELQIGQTWEAFQFISHWKLDNIIIYVDVNGCQCDGKMSDVMNIEPISSRLEAFGAKVFRIDGHNFEELASPASSHKAGSPIVVLSYTNPYQGIELLKNNAPKFHYMRFKSEDEKKLYGEVLASWKP